MTLTKVVRLSCRLFLLFILLGISIFFGLKNVKAGTSEVPKIAINEVMANPSGTDSGNEWLELYNFGLINLDLKDWQVKFFNDPQSLTPTKTIILTSQIINSGQYLVIANNTTTAITNAKGKIILENPEQTYQTELSWLKDVGDGYSMEVIGPPSDPDYQEWLKSVELGGTPGLLNSISKIPAVPTLLAPADKAIFKSNLETNFSWQGDPGLTYEFRLSKNADLSVPEIIESDLTELTFEVEDLPWGKYFWQIIATNGVNESKSTISSFEPVEPVYSNDIVINEILGDPTGLETTGEWIELYNNSKFPVDLSGWIVTDLSGAVKKYTIAKGTVIKAFGYIAISRSVSGITLNNDGDGVTLLWPNGKKLDETKYFNDGDEGWSWARAPNGQWTWTTTPTKQAKNIITFLISTTTQTQSVVVNTTPIEIQTGDYQNYENKLVTILGKVTKTSGSTFYLDDGSGEVKVYIQSKTGIDKPLMHMGDIFKVTGVVDIYGSTWRILPQIQDDIKLIEPAAKAIATTNKSTAKKEVSPMVLASATKSPTQKTIAIDKNPAATVVKGEKTTNNFLSEFMKFAIGLAMILLALLVFQMQKIKPKSIGGHFGDDMT